MTQEIWIKYIMTATSLWLWACGLYYRYSQSEIKKTPDFKKEYAKTAILILCWEFFSLAVFFPVGGERFRTLVLLNIFTLTLNDLLFDRLFKIPKNTPPSQ